MSVRMAAEGFQAVGSEPRLEVLNALVRAGDRGLSINEIQQRVGFPLSTLSHHLRTLAAGGLIVQQRCGRSVVNRADYGRIQELASYLLKECCADVNGMERE